MADKVMCKPRQTRGTLTFKHRYYFAFGVIGIGSLLGLFYHFSPPAVTLRESIVSGKYADSKEEKAKKSFLALILATNKPEAIMKSLRDLDDDSNLEIKSMK